MTVLLIGMTRSGERPEFRPETVRIDFIINLSLEFYTV
jgi:hypothetical protein